MTTFIIIGLVGLVLLGISLVLGDFLDGVFDALAGDVFSSAVLGGFISAFGFGAAIVQGAGGPALVALPVGAVAGVGFAWFAAWLTGLLKDGASDATLTTDDAVGREGKVLSTIPADGLGTVRILVGGHVLQLNARAEQPLEAGTAVHVTSVLSPTAVTVAPIWNELPPSSNPSSH